MLRPADAPSSSDIDRAARLLRAGSLVSFPTETVYGLGADAENDAAVAGIYAAKGRPQDHPLIVHVPAGADLSRWADAVPEAAQRLAARFWPGPLTLILARRDLPALAATGGQPSIGLRVPSHPVALALLEAFGGGIAAPSANRFGRVSPTTAEHVRVELGERVDAILDGGPCQVGVESTIVDLSGGDPVLLRPGGVPREALESVLGVPLSSASATSVRAPGRLPSHYAPGAEVVLVAAEQLAAKVREARAGGVRAFALGTAGQVQAIDPAHRHVLPPDEAAMARALFAALRELDARGAERIVTALPPESGLGAAVADRLRKAAAPREG